jgi:hypothetical protein
MPTTAKPSKPSPSSDPAEVGELSAWALVRRAWRTLPKGRNHPPETTTRVEWAVNHGFRIVWELVTLPVTVAALFFNRRIHPAYRMTWRRSLKLGWEMYRNCSRTMTATSYKAHLLMAAKLLQIPPDTDGVVVECGSFLGGSATNLSLACRIAGRQLIVYDSFEGLPAPVKGERYGNASSEGGFRGSLETVKANIERGGDIDVCTFRKGWFKDTLPHHTEPVVMMFLDVDYQASLHDCLINLWPKLVAYGFVFIDEYVLVDYCAVFFSEKYWRTYFGTTPPGLQGVGTGVPLGQFYEGPFLATPPLQTPSSIGYTFKGSSGYWDYYPEEIAGAANGRGATEVVARGTLPGR